MPIHRLHFALTVSYVIIVSCALRYVRTLCLSEIIASSILLARKTAWNAGPASSSARQERSAWKVGLDVQQR
jgi:hypothetical protein